MITGAAAQTPGLAYVQRQPAVVSHHIDTGRLRKPLGKHDLVVVATRRGLAEAGHVFEGGKPLLLHHGQQDDQDLGGGLSVAQGTVRGPYRGVEALREVRQRCTGVRHEAARQAHGVQGRAGEAAPLQDAQLVVQEAQVEAGVVGDQDGAGRELDEPGQHLVDERRVGDHVLADARDAGDEARDGHARIDQLREGGHLGPALYAHGADLGDLGITGRAAGGLQVDHGEGDAGEVPVRGPPACQADVDVAFPDEALVFCHDVVDERPHELRWAVADREEPRPHVAVVERLALSFEQRKHLV